MATSNSFTAKKVKNVEKTDSMAFGTVVILIVMIIIAMFLYLSYFGVGGIVGKVLGGLFLGIFGWSAWILPICAILGYVFVLVNRGDRRVPRKVLSFIVAIWLLLGISDLLFKQEIISEYYTSNHVLHKSYFECMSLTFEDIINKGKGNAGIFGRLISTVFSKVTGETAAIVIMIVLFILCLFIFYGIFFMATPHKKNSYRQEMKHTYNKVNYEKHQSTHRPSVMMQAVNLKEMNHTLDMMEENAHKNAFKKSVLEEIVTDDKTGKAVIKRTINKEISSLSDVSNNKIPLTNTNVISTRQNVYNALESTPIFRDELDRKFGKKKNSVHKTDYADMGDEQ